MTGLEPLVLGYLAAWCVRRARHAGERIEAGTDLVVDSALDQLQRWVSGRIGSPAALQRFEAATLKGVEATEPDQVALTTVLSDALENDEARAQIQEIVDRLGQLEVKPDVEVVQQFERVVSMMVVGIDANGHAPLKSASVQQKLRDSSDSTVIGVRLGGTGEK